jgi:ribosomal protein S21
MQRPKKGISLQVKISDFSSFDSALRVFSAMTLDVVREAKEKHYYRPKLSRRNRKRRGKALEKRNQERGYINELN